MAKELGTDYRDWEKGFPTQVGTQRNGGGDCLTKTQGFAKTKVEV